MTVLQLAWGRIIPDHRAIRAAAVSQHNQFHKVITGLANSEMISAILWVIKDIGRGSSGRRGWPTGPGVIAFNRTTVKLPYLSFHSTQWEKIYFIIDLLSPFDLRAILLNTKNFIDYPLNITFCTTYAFCFKAFSIEILFMFV